MRLNNPDFRVLFRGNFVPQWDQLWETMRKASIQETHVDGLPYPSLFDPQSPIRERLDKLRAIRSTYLSSPKEKMIEGMKMEVDKVARSVAEDLRIH